MDGSLLKQIEALRAAPIEVIRQKHRELFGEEPRSRNRHSLVRRIAWRLQANGEGGLSERARQRALEIANDADVRVLPPRERRIRSSVCGRAEPVSIAAFPRSGSY